MGRKRRRFIDREEHERVGGEKGRRKKLAGMEKGRPRRRWREGAGELVKWRSAKG